MAQIEGANKELHCARVLEKFPDSQAWSMKLCHYLQLRKSGKKNEKLALEIQKQIKIEDPAHEYLNILVKEL